MSEKKAALKKRDAAATERPFKPPGNLFTEDPPLYEIMRWLISASGSSLRKLETVLKEAHPKAERVSHSHLHLWLKGLPGGLDGRLSKRGLLELDVITTIVNHLLKELDPSTLSEEDQAAIEHYPNVLALTLYMARPGPTPVPTEISEQYEQAWAEHQYTEFRLTPGLQKTFADAPLAAPLLVLLERFPLNTKLTVRELAARLKLSVILPHTQEGSSRDEVLRVLEALRELEAQRQVQVDDQGRWRLVVNRVRLNNGQYYQPSAEAHKADKTERPPRAAPRLEGSSGKGQAPAAGGPPARKVYQNVIQEAERVLALGPDHRIMHTALVLLTEEQREEVQQRFVALVQQMLAMDSRNRSGKDIADREVVRFFGGFWPLTRSPTYKPKAAENSEHTESAEHTETTETTDPPHRCPPPRALERSALLTDQRGQGRERWSEDRR